MKRLLAVGLVVLLAGLIFLAVGCGPGGGSPTAVTSPPPGAAVKLAFTTQPAGAAAGSAFETQPVVVVQDAAGNIVTGYRGLVELTVNTGAGGAQLYGGTKIISANGVVEFKSLSIHKAGVYTLTASSSTLAPATSLPFTIVPGPPGRLAFTKEPSGGVAGSPLTPQPVVAVQDQYGNTAVGYEGSVTLSATITLSTGSSDYYGMSTTQTETTAVAIYGTLTVPVVESVARFDDISAELAIPGYRLTATSGSLEPATSRFFTISPAAPAKLEITVQPEGATAGIPFKTQPKVAVEDIYGNVVTSSRASINLSITPGSGSAGAILSGTTTLVAEDAMGGLAEFTDLSIDQAGPAFMLTATSGGLPSVTSQPFDVSAP
jgi:hypothetical protein